MAYLQRSVKCGGDQLHIVLHQLLCKCWEEGAVLQEKRDSIIPTLYTNSGDRSDCNNYRGISLLCVAGKLFARVALNFIAFSSLQKECTLSLSVVFDPNAQRLI